MMAKEFEGTGHRRDADRVVVHDPLVSEDVVESRLVVHSDVRLVVVEGGESDGRGGQKIGQAQSGLVFGESLLPVIAQHPVAEIVVAVEPDPARELRARVVMG